MRDGHALLDQSIHLANIFEVESKEDKDKDRLRLRTMIAVVKCLTFQSCALRGHDERPESRYRGNFLEMLKLLAEFFPDVQAIVLGNAPQVCKYTSQDRFFHLIHVANTKALTVKMELCSVLYPSMDLMYKIFEARSTMGQAT